MASNRLTIRSESALLSSIVLLRSLLAYMSDSTLMAHLSVGFFTRRYMESSRIVGSHVGSDQNSSSTPVSRFVVVKCDPFPIV